MANVDQPDGLKPNCYLNGAPYNGQANEYQVEAGEAVQVMIGDPVKLSNTNTTSSSGLPAAEIAAAGDVLIGVCIGTRMITRDSTIYREASTERVILVADDPQILFEIQEDSAAGVIALASIGLNATLITSAGSTFTGFSAWELDESTVATTNTLDVQIVRGLDRTDNTLVSSWARWLVKLNNHQYVDGTTGVA